MKKKPGYLFTLPSFLRIFFSIIIFLCSYCSFAQLSLGENPGYYGAQYTDQQLYDLMYAAGARSTRSSVPVQYDLTYGMATFQARLQYPYSTKGMRNNTFFLFASAGPTYSTESTKKTAGGHQSWLPTGIYNAPFNADGSINTANAWAKYIYDVMQSVGPYFTYYEVWNEPDLTNSSDSYNDSTVSATSWQKREPTPDELTNMYDSLENYVQLCKIANQVVKKYQPAAKICTGGIGYQWFYQWFLRKGGGQWVDELSFHEYPYFDWSYCVWTGTTCGPAGFHRNSDFAANAVLAELQRLRQIETNEKATHLPAMMTETNIPRWSYVTAGNMEVFPQNRPWGSDRTQRNFTIKVFSKMMLAGLNSFYFYQTGETGDSGLNNGPTASEIDAMGMYKNLDKATVGKEVLTGHGLAIKTMQTLMGNYKVDATQPTLPTGVDGVRFDSSGNKIYVLWAITTLDTLETASGSFTLPTGTFKKYLYDGSSPGTVTGTVALTGDPFIIIQNAAPASSVSCNAGTNQTITLPATATLDASGSTVTNSTISSYNWTQVSGPNNSAITNAKTVTATAGGLIPGPYTFQVVVKDANGDSCTGTVQITVKAAPTPPIVSAGSNQTITFPANASLSGTATDVTGTITSTVWSEVSGPDNNATFTNGNTLAATAKNLSIGIYIFQLTVTDNNNLSASSQVTVIVSPPQPPVVSAGSNQTITLPANASLSGIATDAGTITNIVWSEYSGPDNNATFINGNSLAATANGLSAGTYIFQLTVTDNNNLSASSTVTVIVNPPNQPPVVSAGSNQTITLPINTATLTGIVTKGTGNISTYLWSEISGPDNNNVSFTNGNKIFAIANNLALGTYVFQLMVTDVNNLFSSATVTVTVNPQNQPPVVNAGSNQTIYLPTTASLVGTANDLTGNITSILWSEVSGPDNNATFTSANSIATTVNNLSAGTYIFKLTATDNNNLSASSQVTITVSQPLTVSAGSNQTILLPTNSVTLSGSANDATGNIISYSWSEVSGPNSLDMPDPGLGNITTLNDLVAGVYVFQLTITDDNNFSASSTVIITVNALPVVDAGSDQTVVLPANASLAGSASDATGNITNYAWTEISGPDNNASFTSANKISTTVKNLSVGIYTFQLTVTDNNDLSSSSTVNVIVEALPVVSAGSNQTIVLPNNSATLTGTVTDAASISSYTWSKISGPAIDLSDQELSMTLNDLTAGVYLFNLSVTDDNNLSASSQVTITVTYPPPTVSAGTDQTITLPTNFVSLSGSADDAAGNISYSWSEISGPDNNASFSDATSISPTVSDLAAGTYVFQLTVTADNNSSASSTVNIIVNLADQPPVVSAGFDQTITLPASSATLSGTATKGTGKITSYQWTQLTGPGSLTSFSDQNALSTTVSDLIAGPYTFELTVTDANDLSTAARVNITVVNAPPVVSAGTDQTIILPINTTTLTGNVTDASGSGISNYTWSEISGPDNNATFTSSNSISTTVNDLSAGTYMFQLLATDNNNLSASATVSITVSAPIMPPVVSAGSDQTIALPANSAALIGTATNGTGNITTYAWTEVSGPSNITITNATKISASVSGLIAGTYIFQLKVTDNNNLSAASTVTINVNALPVVNAGSNQTINLPANTVTLTGTATDATGTITTYAWTEVSGPSTITITNSNQILASVGNLIGGSYIFQLSVTDNNSLSSTATVTIKVNGPPVVSAGSNQTINLPANTSTLTGTATDATGTITTYAWTEVSGPSTITVTNATKISASVSGLVAGSYVFQLKVTDNNSLSATATVTINVNALPVVSAGSNQTINLPANTATLTGTATDATGTITTYAWTEVSGPSTITITNSNQILASVGNLIGGSYIFQLKVTDNNNLSLTATVTIKVNALPVVSAGSNQTINLPANTATLTGTATDATGTITTYAWTEVSGPSTITVTNATKISASVSGLVAGSYIFQLKVTDNNSLSASATVTINVNALPVVSAGSNQTINLPANTATLTGTATDATGTITTYAWTEVSGPSTITITTANQILASVGNLIGGSYIFQLKVTDNNNLSSTATVTIKVNALPVVSAGSNQTINLPANTATLTGTATDATGTITTYAWTEVSGPSTITVTNATKISANVSGLVAGSYVFQLKVTDNNSLSATATVTIKVNALPVVSAGSNQTINLPANTATLTGTATDATGTITTYAWTEVSGPSTITVTNATKISASVSGLVAGSYVFQLKVTDNNSLSATATVTLKVNALPVVSAGSNQAITLPVNTATLTGTATDATGTITTYAWTEVSGPSTITVTNATKISASVSGLVAGSYVFQLKVTDNNSLSASASVTITVANPPPVVSAGTNQTINLPTATATLTGTATEATGTITAYAWTQVSGPSTATLTNATKVSATASKLVAGVYVFQLKVTDSHSLTASATVTITVVNPPPVVSAGANQTINLPATTATLTGTATDATGTITAYAWTEVSGPNTATITNATKATATLSKLVAGTYVFQLKVTDSHGLTATATVTIIMNQLPVANAGTNQTITLPTNKATLSGSKSTDADGTIASYSWARVSSPSTPTITGNKTVTATISALVAGTYVYQLTVTDNRGATASATTQVVVRAAGTGSVIAQTLDAQIETDEQPDSTATTIVSPVAEKIILFPDPAQGIINLELNSDTIGTMRINIFDMLGRLALTEQTNKSSSYFNQAIDISRLTKGFYAMEILIGQHKRILLKFIKQ